MSEYVEYVHMLFIATLTQLCNNSLAAVHQDGNIGVTTPTVTSAIMGSTLQV